MKNMENVYEKLNFLQIFKEEFISCIWSYIYKHRSLISLILLVIFLLYIYIKWNTSYFKRRGIKYLPYRIPFLGNMCSVLLAKEHIQDNVNKTYTAFPDEKYVGHMQMNRPLIMIRDLELVKQVAIKDFDHFLNHQISIDENCDKIAGGNLFALKGDKWKDMRATLSPAFTSSKMRNMFVFISETAKQMVDFYLKKANEEEHKSVGYVELEMRDNFTRYTNDVIATTIFGIKINSLEDRDNDFFNMGKLVMNLNVLRLIKFVLLVCFPKIIKWTGIQFFDGRMKKFFCNIVLETMKKRESHNIVRNDMIQLLMEAKKGSLKNDTQDDEDIGFATVKESHVGRRNVNRKWTDYELIAQTIIFFIGGFDPPATLMCFLAHELTVNPNIQKRLQEEIDSVLNEKENVEYNDITKMKYLDMVVSEILRFWPPQAATDRECIIPYKLPPSTDSSESITVKVGEGLWIPIYSFHHDPQYFPNPEKFDPERFSDENKKNIKPFSYLPFGVGPRNCIGSRFALLEAKVVIFYLLANFDFVITPKTSNPIKLIKFLGMMPENGFWIGLKPRKV